MVNSGRMKRRILHTSDLHLESVGDKACHSLEVLVNLAIQARADLVVVAGDLFEHYKVRDDLARFVSQQLRRLPIQAIILPGNHDRLAPDSIYQRTDLWQNLDNVRIFRAPDGETIDLLDLGMSLWGKPITSDDTCRPLAGMPQPKANGLWQIAVAHGYYIGINSDTALFPSLHITLEEITASGWDYIALGHVPLFRCVSSESVKAYYCGSPSYLDCTVAIVDFAEGTGAQASCYSLRNSASNLRLE